MPEIALEVREPQQARSRKALARIYEATNCLLAERSFDRISVGEIAKRAGVSVGSIYQRFGRKDDLMWALYNRYLEEAVQKAKDLKAAAKENKADRDEVMEAISFVCNLFNQHRGIVRTLLIKYRGQPEEIPAPFHNTISAVYAQLDASLRSAGASPRKAKIGREFILAACREHCLFSAFSSFSSANGDAQFRSHLKTAVEAMFN